MKIKVLPITLLLLYSTFVSSQTEAQKASFQIFRDSCNKELDKQFKKQDYDSALRTIDVAQKRYDNLDNKLKKELNLEDKLFYARASIYADINDIELSEKYLIRTAQSGYKDIGWLYYTYAGIYVSKNDEKSAVYFMKKAVKAGYNGLCSWQNLIYIPGKENIDFNNELIKLGELKRLSSPNEMPLPWHLTDIKIQLKKDVRLEKLEIDFSVLSDIPNDLNLYIAPLGYGFINSHGYYGGIQTKVDGIGKSGLIFSRWDERDTAAIRTDSVGYKCSSGNEGDFISVRRKFEWTKGQYKISLTADPDTIMLRGQVHRWVTMSIYSYNTKQEVINGSLAFPGDTLMLNKELWIFVEIYSDGFKSNIALKDIPVMQFSFDKFVVNGQEQVQSGEANYWIEYPKYADATYKDGKIFLTTGRKYPRINPRLKQGLYVEPLFDDKNR
jgi:hypothetical protein